MTRTSAPSANTRSSAAALRLSRTTARSSPPRPASHAGSAGSTRLRRYVIVERAQSRWPAQQHRHQDAVAAPGERRDLGQPRVPPGRVGDVEQHRARAAQLPERALQAPRRAVVVRLLDLGRGEPRMGVEQPVQERGARPARPHREQVVVGRAVTFVHRAASPLSLPGRAARPDALPRGHRGRARRRRSVCTTQRAQSFRSSHGLMAAM